MEGNEKENGERVTAEPVPTRPNGCFRQSLCSVSCSFNEELQKPYLADDVVENISSDVDSVEERDLQHGGAFSLFRSLFDEKGRKCRLQGYVSVNGRV